MADSIEKVGTNQVSISKQSVSDPSEIKFTTENGAREVLRITANGDIYVNGKLAANDMEVVEGLRQFLKEAGFIKPPEIEKPLA